MPTLTIKFKVVAAFIVATILAVSGLYYASRDNYERNVAALSRQSLDTARHAFDQLSSAEVAKMQSLVIAVVANSALTSQMSMGQRDALYKAAEPLYKQLNKDQGITSFNFIDTEEKRILCVQDPKNPKLSGTKAVRFNVQESARTKTWSFGLGLGFHGVALRVTHPVFDSGQLTTGSLLGYLELGVEINEFIAKLKSLTGDEFGLVIKKKFLEEEKWVSGRQKRNLRNNWADQPEVVVASNTTQREEILRLDRDVTSVPDEGLTLGVVKADGRQFVRSVFPVRDAAKEKIGAVFVLTDVTRVANDLQRSLIRTILASLLLVVVLMSLLILLLTKLVFRRLNEISRVATRVVGGDFETPIRVGIKDEIGQFEELLEQFRSVVVSLIGEMMRLQGESEAGKKS
jgi:HAMP domain-containing protein